MDRFIELAHKYLSVGAVPSDYRIASKRYETLLEKYNDLYRQTLKEDHKVYTVDKSLPTDAKRFSAVYKQVLSNYAKLHFNEVERTVDQGELLGVGDIMRNRPDLQGFNTFISKLMSKDGLGCRIVESFDSVAVQDRFDRKMGGNTFDLSAFTKTRYYWVGGRQELIKFINERYEFIIGASIQRRNLEEGAEIDLDKDDVPNSSSILSLALLERYMDLEFDYIQPPAKIHRRGALSEWYCTNPDVDLSLFQITHLGEPVPPEHCANHALNILLGKTLTQLTDVIQDRHLAKLVATQLHLRLKVHKYSTTEKNIFKSDEKYECKMKSAEEFESISLGSFDNHYFVYCSRDELSEEWKKSFDSIYEQVSSAVKNEVFDVCHDINTYALLKCCFMSGWLKRYTDEEIEERKVIPTRLVLRSENILQREFDPRPKKVKYYKYLACFDTEAFKAVKKLSELRLSKSVDMTEEDKVAFAMKRETDDFETTVDEFALGSVCYMPVHYRWITSGIELTRQELEDFKKMSGKKDDDISDFIEYFFNEVEIKVVQVPYIYNLVYILDDSSLIFVHNLKYDFHFINKVFHPKNTGFVQKDGTLYQYEASVHVKGKKAFDYVFRDSYLITTFGLKDFGKIYGLKQPKAKFPYLLFQSVDGKVTVQQVASQMDGKDFEDFKKCYATYLKEVYWNNLDPKWFDENPDEKVVDLFDYCKYYCALDTKVQMQGLLIHRKLILELTNICSTKIMDLRKKMTDTELEAFLTDYNIKNGTNVKTSDNFTYVKVESKLATVRSSKPIDIFHHLTNASVADSFIHSCGCFDGVYELGGVTRAFVGRGVYGGVCQTAYGKKVMIEPEIIDGKMTNKNDVAVADAVSLYPSAMQRLSLEGRGYPIGEARLLETRDCNELLQMKEAYFVEIKLLDVREDLNYPLGIFNVFVDNKAVFIHTREEFKKYVRPSNNIVVVSNIRLQCLVKFYGLKFEILQGLWWPDGYNSKVGPVQEYLMMTRIDFKKMKKKFDGVDKDLVAKYESLQLLCKQVGNSSYGKLIIKCGDDKIVIAYDEEKAMAYAIRNDEIIKDVIEYGGLFFIKCVDYDASYNRCHCGALVLDQSKEITMEFQHAVSQLEYPLSLICYTDTDSFHMFKRALNKVVEKFDELYGKRRDELYGVKGYKLIGTDFPGCFHSDLDLKEMHKDLYLSESQCEMIDGGADVNKSENLVSRYSIYVGRKSYGELVQFLCKNKEVLDLYNFRMKGATTESLISSLLDENGIKCGTCDIMKLYRRLFNGEEVVVDLCNRVFVCGEKMKPVSLARLDVKLTDVIKNTKKFPRTLVFPDGDGVIVIK